MANNKLDLNSVEITPGGTCAIYKCGDHSIYWLGVEAKTAFRCNTYMVVSGGEAVVVDPGSAQHFQTVLERVGQVIDPKKVVGLVLSHQDPDVAASMGNWLELNSRLDIITSPRTHVLLPHYGKADFKFVNTEERPTYEFGAGSKLTFVDAPFLHFPGAIATYDNTSRFLFSGDVWAALSMEWTLCVQNFEDHIPKMNLFHLDYMASNVAARGFANKLDKFEIDAILPQHGSVIGANFVNEAKEYLRDLRCGLDLIYE